MNNQQPAQLSFDKNTHTLHCSGSWTVSAISDFLKQPPLTTNKTNRIQIEGGGISRMDTTGAWALHQQANALKKSGKTISFSGFSEEHTALFQMVEAALPEKQPRPKSSRKPSFLYVLGKKSVDRYFSLLNGLAFLGEVIVFFGRIIMRPARLQYKSFLNVIDETGYRAIAIVGLLSFLIGIVLAYQSGQQLKTYGANIYIISLIGIAMLQEFGPLITAIIVAGRTSSAFTAQIGTMQLNEEIDALRTMGVSPVIRLVIPKILGLIISLPLLIILADICGVLGGMLVADKMLNISYYSFLLNFPNMIQLQTLLNGLIKGPFFACIIAGVGCYQGFQVVSSADSVGRKTTKSVVQSIFLIIVADALFSIILPWQSV
ncbi:MAG: transporter permease protein [Gammaproteobacteria bacterium]|jgi:phospholipid/cholesterol/gamma-HCH transport system permease protein|nr:transporter permease protein [Gammaproteobacteria bacterium]